MHSLNSYVKPRRLKVFSKLLLEDGSPHLKERATLIGAYLNDEFDIVFFTTRGFYHLVEEKMRYISYRSMFSVSLPVKPEEEDTSEVVNASVDQKTITVGLHDGTQIFLPIKNETDEHPDLEVVYEYLLSKVISGPPNFEIEPLSEVHNTESLCEFLEDLENDDLLSNDGVTNVRIAMEDGFPQQNLLEELCIDPALLQRPDMWRLIALFLSRSTISPSGDNDTGDSDIESVRYPRNDWRDAYALVGDKAEVEDEDAIRCPDDYVFETNGYVLRDRFDWRLPDTPELSRNLLCHFTDEALDILAVAKSLASEFFKQSVGPEFVLLALVKNDSRMTNSILKKVGICSSDLRDEMVQLFGVHETATGTPTFSTSAIKVFQRAIDLANLQSTNVSAQQLILAISELDTGITVELLAKFDNQDQQ